MGDLLGFDSAPSPAAPSENTGSSEFGAFQASSNTASSEFGAFQASSAPAPANASDEFAAFGQMRASSNTFAATPVQQEAPAFDAFGSNNGGISNNNQMMNNNVTLMANSMNMMNNNGIANNSVTGMQNAFGTMNVGSNTPAGNMQQFQPQSLPGLNDDDFGDFADAKKDASFSVSSKTTKSSNPMSGLINLDGLSKNPSKKMTMNQPVVVNEAAAQYRRDVQQGAHSSGMNSNATNNMSNIPSVVSAGGSDAISSMFAPVPTPQQQQQRGSVVSMNSQASGGGNRQMQPQQFMMNQMPNQGMQGNPSGRSGGMNPQMQQQQFRMNQMNMNANQMGMNQMNMNANQMGMNQVGANNQMGFQQQSFNPQLGGMGGQNR